MAVKLIVLDLRGTKDLEDVRRRVSAYEEEQDEIEAFSHDRGWATAAHVTTVGEVLLSICQFMHNQTMPVSRTTFDKAWAEWKAGKKGKGGGVVLHP